MTKKTMRPNSVGKQLESKVAATEKARYILRLYVAGTTAMSARAISNVRSTCERYLAGRYELEVIDLFQRPGLAQGEQIIAAPTLIKKLPLPLRRIIGDMSNQDKILVGLDLQKLRTPV